MGWTEEEMRLAWAGLAAALLLSGAVQADDRKEITEEDGCRVEREWKSDGGYKQVSECRPDRRHAGRGEGKEEYWERGCKVIREWKKDGSSKEEVECKGHP